MALFTARSGDAYAQTHMPKPAVGDGPWGEAVRYWLDAKKIRQADLARDTGIEPKTISSITRGFHTTTRMLAKIAAVLDLPLDAVLVSPDRKSAAEERKRMVQEVTERVVRALDTHPPPIAEPTMPEGMRQLNRELKRETVKAQRLVPEKRTKHSGRKK